MAVEDAAQAEILHGVLHRRVGLQLDALLQAVDVDPGHAVQEKEQHLRSDRAGVLKSK